MITLNKIAYDILLIANGGVLSDDNPVDLRQVKFWINNQRALMIRQAIKGRNIDDNLIQDLGCVELEKADPSDCCTISTGCTVVRSKDDIPEPVTLHRGLGITHVGSVDKSQLPISIVSYNRSKFVGNGRFTSKLIYAYYHNSRIYLVGNNNDIKFKALRFINVRGIFEDPESVGSFNHCGGGSCYTDDDAYPLNANMIPVIKDAVLRQNMGIIQRAPQDISNDSNSTPVQ